jgi:dihydroxyacetone kinase
MLDVWHPVAEEMLRSRAGGLDLGGQLQRAVTVARTAETATALLLAKKGRASRLGERSLGNIDPGASSARVIIEAIATSLG